jgi:hypothetical protein
MKVLYVSGPYSATNAWTREANIRKAEATALVAWTMGCAAICPHTLARFYHGTLPEAMWLAGDLAILDKCDGVLMVEGWESSVGSKAEHAYAKDQGIPIFTSLTAVERWLKAHDQSSARSGDPGAHESRPPDP